MKIDVYFRKFDDGEVIAIWEEQFNPEKLIASYMHIGQHGAADPALIDELQPASEAEYASLLSELQSIGYTVTVVE